MAKNSDANPLEKYLEKIVLGICALALIVVVAHWVISSPQTVEVINPDDLSGTTLVPPDKADEAIRLAATRVRQRNMQAAASPFPKLNWGSQFAEAMARPFPPLPALDDGTPSFPIQRPTPIDANAMPGLPELVAMIQPPGKPFGWAGMEVRQPAIEEAVFHGVCVYPWGDLRKRWEEKLSRLPNSLVVVRVEVQVQTRASDGQYPPGEGAPAHLASLPPVDSQGQPLPMPAVPEFDGNNATAVRSAALELSAPRWQQYILEPPYFNIASPRGGWVSWRLHLAENPVSRQDLTPAGSPLPSPSPSPFPMLTPGPGPGPMRGPVGGEGGRSAGPSAGPLRGPSVGGGPGPMRGPGADYQPTGAGSATPTPAVGPSTVGPVFTEGPVTMGVRAMPDLAKQQETGSVLVAFHDNTLKISTPCRYRVRVVFLNPLLSQEAVQNRARDSFRKEIPSPWSEWSDDVQVENPTRFFVTRKTPAGDKLQVTVFTQKMGQTVRKAFDVEAGISIGGPAMVPVAIAANAPTSVDFSTGCVVVAIDMERKFVRRGGGGILGASSLDLTTAAVTYLDEKGRLRTRVMAEDLLNPEYLNLLQQTGGAP
jgi:hypothetical protein